MAVSKTSSTALAGVVLGLFLTGGAEPGSDAGGQISTIPVVTTSQNVGKTLTVCMYPRARPEPFRVVRASCQSGADHCTAFVALRGEGDQNLLVTFDLLNPPVEATGPTCDRPVWQSSGILRPQQR